MTYRLCAGVSDCISTIRFYNSIRIRGVLLLHAPMTIGQNVRRGFSGGRNGTFHAPAQVPLLEARLRRAVVIVAVDGPARRIDHLIRAHPFGVAVAERGVRAAAVNGS